MLVVDDDQTIRQLVAVTLDRHDIVEAADGDEAMAVLEAEHIDVVILDVMMPGRSGQEVLTDIKARHAGIPVVMLTALTDDETIVAAFGSGAADHIAKPFSPAVLEARVDAALRAAAPTPTSGAGVHVDFDTRSASVDGRSVDLTRREFALLAHLATHAGHVFTQEELVEEMARSGDAEVEGALVECIRRLRHKIEDDPDAPTHIRTVRGVGYRFDNSARAERRITANRAE